MQIKFIHDYQQHKDGDEVDMPVAQARLMIFRGYAQAMPPESATAATLPTDAAETVKPATQKRPPIKREKVVNQAVPLTGTSVEP